MMSKESERYKRWLARREKAGTDDAAYEDFVSAMTGQHAQETAGVTTSGEPGRGAMDLSETESLSDSEIYRRYVGELDGTSAKKRAEETARQEREERAGEHRRHARLAGYPMPDFYRD